VSRPTPSGPLRSRPALVACAGLLAALASGCGSGKISVPTGQATEHRGAVLFNQRCSGCHSLKAANAYGSRSPGNRYLKYTERTDGPNFNIRHESRDDVLFAIRNGGFSGAIMPANIVVGRDAEAVALFVERYAGRKAPPTSGVKSGSPTGSSGNK
jgi:mono/diheme cytochrome c family protein